LKIKHLTYILFLLGVISCSEEKHPLLKDDDKALALLIDLNIANIAKNKYPTTMRDSVNQDYKKQICELHDLQEEELDTMLWMMQADFDRYNKLYTMLVDTLKKIETNLGDNKRSPRVPYQKERDSIMLNRKR